MANCLFIKALVSLTKTNEYILVMTYNLHDL